MGWWGAAGMAMGINLISYTDFNRATLRIRPEIGLGFGRWKVVYGYNIPLTRKNLKE